jgi:hypothetical protein
MDASIFFPGCGWLVGCVIGENLHDGELLESTDDDDDDDDRQRDFPTSYGQDFIVGSP